MIRTTDGACRARTGGPQLAKLVTPPRLMTPTVLAARVRLDGARPDAAFASGLALCKFSLLSDERGYTAVTVHENLKPPKAGPAAMCSKYRNPIPSYAGKPNC